MPRLITPSYFIALRQPSLLRFSHGNTPRRLYSITVDRTYDDAINALNTLQTPHKLLEELRKNNIKFNESANDYLRLCLDRIGHTQSDLEKLNIVHVAGTKGKGSTCSYVDSILTQYRKSHGTPRRVGLYTSPHLVAVRERIRINSSPISAELFAKYFFEVWDALQSGASGPIKPPDYFKYLTVMSYHAFLREGIDTAIYEVGLGGQYDSTNIADHPTVTGITTLGIDHVLVLGETIEEIAWQKAGIQKPGVPSFTVNQLPAATKVIEDRAKERYVRSLKVVDLDPRLQMVNIRPNADFQKSNASLAIALAETTLKSFDPAFQLPPDSLPKEFVDGLEQMVWRGRCEKKVEGNITWHLDGAHTADSIIISSRWFGEECTSKPGTRVLIFNQQGHRDALLILEGLYSAITVQGLVKFDHVIFCTSAGQQKDFVNACIDNDEVSDLTLQNAFAERWRALDPSSSTTIKVLPFIEDALEHVRSLSAATGKEGREVETQVLITGSIHLVGRALGALEGVDAL